MHHTDSAPIPWTDHAARFSLAGKTALVTGACQGIGLAVARGLAAAGANVVLADRNEDIKTRANELVEAGYSARGAVADITSQPDIDRLFAEIEAAAWSPDILVNNAAILITKKAAELEASEWQRVIDTNLSASFFLAQRAARLFAARGGGTIINMSSIVGRTARRNLTAYIAAKSGIDGLTRALAADLGGKGITVNAIAPGFIETEMSRTGNDSFERLIAETVPLKRWGRPEDIAGVAVFLASDAGAYINGQTLYVDGGYTAVSR